MKTRVAGLIVAVVVATGCGGDDGAADDQTGTQTGQGCQLHIRGAVSEDLPCTVMAVDASVGNPLATGWVFELVAYRGTTEVGATATFVHEGRPSLATAYGWTASTVNVSDGIAERIVPDPLGDPGDHLDTHQAMYAVTATGTLAVTFTRIPAPGATGAGLLDVHGGLQATLPASDAVSAPVTFSATF